MTKRKRPKKRSKRSERSAALVRRPETSFAEIFERVVVRGVVVEIEKGAERRSERRGDASTWLRVSVGGVDILTVETGLSWRSLVEEGGEEE